ncbi:uncharacterized protein LOC134706777 [Mytilus trossulus]|uniref:uncharacterized protein LOC134706777 n=1 Tax=Mytilus trossulus TaxID=6551 RepID=UPI003007A616
MGQQMSVDDQDEGFKNIISRMLQEADEENDSAKVNSGKKSNEKFITDSDVGLENKVKVNNSEQSTTNEQKEKDKTELIDTKTSTELTDDVYKKSHLEPNDDLFEKSHADFRENKNLGMSVSSEFRKSTENAQSPNLQNIKQEQQTDESGCLEKDQVKITKEKESISAPGKKSATRTEMTNEKLKEITAKHNAKDKPKSLETVFLKDRIDNLITSCLSSKNYESDIEGKNKSVVDSNQTSLQLIKQENRDTFDSSTSHSLSSRSEEVNKVVQDNNTNLVQSQNCKTGNLEQVQNVENQNNLKMEINTQGVSKQKEGNRETTTFQTLIEKVLDNSLQKTKSVDSGPNSNGCKQVSENVRQISDNRIPNRNHLHTIKNEIRNELLVKDTSDRPRTEAKPPDDMSINKSKVVYLKDHIEKVLEKSFQNSSKKDNEEIRGQERTPSKQPDERFQHKENDLRTIHRERSQSLVGEPVRHYRDRSHSFSAQEASIEMKRHKSLEAYDLEHLGPPKLIKVSDIYPDVNRDQSRYLQPPRIDTFDGNSRGSFKSAMSPGGSYSRSPLDQSPVSPYYNHSPNSWHGHSPREHVIPSNLSPKQNVPSPGYQSARYPVSPGYPPSRYSNGPQASQKPISNRGFQQPYPQAVPGYLTNSPDSRTNYQTGNQQISPNAQQHMNRNYPQHFSTRPVVSSSQNFHSNELHSKHQMSPGQPYQQASPRQLPYPSNHPQMSPSPHVPYSNESTQQMPRAMMPSPQHYPTHSDHNQIYPPTSNMHHVRQTHPGYSPMNNRNNGAGYVDTPMRNAQISQVAPRMAGPMHRSPQYNVEGHNRNPSVSSAMALGPVPPQHYFKQQSQKPPQLFPSSPPIPSVREFHPNRAVFQTPPHAAVRPETKYRQPEAVEIPPRIPSRSEEKVNRQPRHEHALDFSVNREDSNVDQDMQPLDLTCKVKTKPKEVPITRPASKCYSGFEYLVKGQFEKGVFEENSGSHPHKQAVSSQYSSQTQVAYPNYEAQNRTENMLRPSESDTGNRSYSQMPVQQSLQGQNDCHNYRPNSRVQVTMSPQTSSLNDDMISTDNCIKVQSPINQSVHLPQDQKKGPNVSRHEPIQNILGSHSPTDILYLICRLCGQTYGSPYGFRKHFRNQHGFEPRAEHTIVQTISETKTAKTALLSPSPNQQAILVAQHPNTLSTSSVDENKISVAENPRALSHTKTMRVPVNQEGDTETVAIVKEENMDYMSSDGACDIQKMESDGGNRKYLECHECGQTFQLNDFGAYKRHCRQHGHPKINNPFDPSFTSDQQNMNSNSGEDIKSKDDSRGDISNVCKECNIPFASSDFLKEHMNSIHPEITIYSCSTCSDKFLDEAAYQIHIKSHIETKDTNDVTVSMKKRLIGDFQKGQFESKQEEIISSTSVTKSAADSMVITASPDSSSDMIKKTLSVVDSQTGPLTPNVQSQSDKQSNESDSNLEIKMEISRQNSCDSATQKIDDSSDSDTLYLHKKFGSKRKFITSLNNDVIEPKVFRKDKSPGNTRSPSVLSTNSCDSEQPDTKSESDQESNISSLNMDGMDDSKLGKCSGKTEARHQLPFVWDRVTRSQVGRKPAKN